MSPPDTEKTPPDGENIPDALCKPAVNLTAVVPKPVPRPVVKVTYSRRAKTDETWRARLEESLSTPGENNVGRDPPRRENAPTAAESCINVKIGLETVEAPVVLGKTVKAGILGDGAVRQLRDQPLTSFFRPLPTADRTSTAPRKRPNPTSSHTSTSKRAALASSSPRSGASAASSPPAKKYEQLRLDLGQRNAGVVRCRECEMEYITSQHEDRELHERYHRAVVGGIDWAGYKTEQVVENFPDDEGARIILVTSDSSYHEKKKAREIISIANQELGSIHMSDAELDECQMFLYISGKKRVMGCVVAEKIPHAYRCIPQAAATGAGSGVQFTGTVVDPVPALCGISRVWVFKKDRRKGVASRMLDAVRARFLFGCTLARGSIAFSQPTEAGRALAEGYCGRRDFLVYIGADGDDGRGVKVGGKKRDKGDPPLG
ncbi:ESCO1/2 acetyl-transferase-domain-containing protein [Blyttiomyces helicus]|uniref:ESCO1/2 acetyl-transferase-domain-containing protein n=1 Tax=Blyttiomyces helicus TaxID=388810 RepID=A0A4P9WFJ7_9FUNG|nr:ESCO1/2 acetyl-transferase-domain-containing protein [Blyttiomyces helicus]|eukprot:RKO90533.1 ESCO1/2 acetyl-transferase-domain-containing protein [Blyttiomyces helicus]